MAKRLDYNQIALPETRPFRAVYGYVMQSSLPRVLVELVYLRVSQINNCAARLFRRSAQGSSSFHLGLVPAGRFGNSSEIASAVVFLALINPHSQWAASC
jgi:hypothetical protein